MSQMLLNILKVFLIWTCIWKLSLIFNSFLAKLVMKVNIYIFFVCRYKRHVYRDLSYDL